MIKVKQVRTFLSEAQGLDNKIFKSIQECNDAVFFQVSLQDLGFAKTKCEITFEDDTTIVFDADFSLSCRDGLVATIKYYNKLYSNEPPIWIINKEQFKERSQEWQQFVKDYDLGI